MDDSDIVDYDHIRRGNRTVTNEFRIPPGGGDPVVAMPYKAAPKLDYINTDLRKFALELAAGPAALSYSSEISDIVKRADAFYKFIVGETE